MLFDFLDRSHIRVQTRDLHLIFAVYVFPGD